MRPAANYSPALAGLIEAGRVTLDCFNGMLPLVQEGLITFEVIPLRSYTGFSRLFADRGEPQRT